MALDFSDDHCQGVGFLPRRRGCRPDAQRTTRGARIDQPWQRLCTEMMKRLVVTKEETFVGGHCLHHLARQRVAARAPQTLRQPVKVGQLLAFHDGGQPGFKQVELVNADDQAGFRFQQGGQGLEGERRQRRGHAWAPFSISRSLGAIFGNGSTALQRPAWATAPGMPQTTLDASSCPMAAPPASITFLVPAKPSWPIPVSMATKTRPSHATQAERSIGSTDGRQKFSGGSVVTRARRP